MYTTFGHRVPATFFDGAKKTFTDPSDPLEGNLPSLWLRADQEVYTGGARQFYSADKGLFTLAHASTSAAVQVGTGDFSVSLFVNLTTAPSAEVVLAGKRDTSSGTGWQIRLDSSSRPLIVLTDAGGTTSIRSNSALSTGRWYHLVFAFDRDGNMSAYRNGVALTGSDFFDSLDISARSQSLTGTGALEFGGYSNLTPTEVPSAALSKVLILKGLVNQTAVTSLYNFNNGVLSGEVQDILDVLGSFTLGTHYDYWNLNEALGTANALSYSGSNDLAPSFGELVLNAGFETAGGGGSDVFGSWSEATNGTSTISDEGSIVNSGSHACKISMDGSASTTYVYQPNILLDGHRYQYSVYARNDTTGSLRIGIGAGDSSSQALTSTYTEYTGIKTCNTTGLFLWGLTANGIIYIDDVSVKAVDIQAADGPSVEVASDSIGTNHGIVNVGSESPISKWTTDRPDALSGTLNGSFNFDGTNDYIATLKEDLPTTLSMSAWIKTSSSGTLAIMSNRNGSGNHIFFGIGATKALIYDTQITGYSIYSSGAVNDNNWHHIAVTLKDDEAKLYLDGVLQGTAASSPRFADNPPLYIGFDDGNDAYWDGKASDCRLYDVYLTQEQVSELYAGGEATGATPINRWKLDDGPQTPISDGDPVVSWRSLEGNYRNFIQATPSRSPSYVLSGINSKPAVDFDGVDDLLIASSAFLTGTEGTAIFVYRLDDDPNAYQTILATADEASGSSYAWFLARGATGDPRIKYFNDGNTLDGDATINKDTNYCVVWRSNGTTTTARVNGTDDSLSVDAGSNNGDWFSDTSGGDNVTLGAIKINSGEINFMTGKIAEIIVYPINLSTSSIAKLSSYINSRYGVSA